MNVRSAFRFAIVAFLSTFPLAAVAATYDVRVLFDVDSNRDTGCSVATSAGTVRGVEQILTTSVSVNGTSGTVTGVTRQVCISKEANLFSNPLTVDGGWTAGVSDDGMLLIETHYGNNSLVAPGAAPMRLSFAASSGSQGDALVADLTRNPIAYPERLGRQRAVVTGPARSIHLDGNGDDWSGIDPLGYGGSSSPVLRFVSVRAFSNASDLFFNFQLQANPQAPTAVDDNYDLPTLGATLQIAAPGILGNDSNPGGGAMVPVIDSGVQHGQLTLNDDGSFTYVNDGTSVSQDQFRYRLRSGNLVSNLATVTIVMPGGNPAPGQTYEFVSLDHTTFTTGVNGTFNVVVSGQPTPALSVSGSLPSGVTFVDNGNGTATLSGMPLAGTGGVYPLVITANKNKPHEASQNFTLTVNQPPAITSLNAAIFTVGQPGTFTLTVTGFPAVSLTEAGALPNGVTYNAATHVLSGTPASGTGGVYNVVFTAANGIPPSVNQNFTLTVNEAPSITSAPSTTFQTGVAGTFTITTLGFPKPAITKAGTLPAGVTLTDNGNGTATLSGTPNAGTGGAYPLTLTATNANGVGNQNFTLTVNQPPAITSANNVTFTAGVPGSFTVTATGFPAPSVAEVGTLPNGVTYDAATHVLAGTPAAGTGGVYAITFNALNGVGSTAVQNFTLTINEAPSITSANNTTFQTGVAGTYTITTLGWPKPAITRTGTLPAGVTLTDNGNGTATLAGTPNAGTGGAYPVTLTATNAVSSSNQNFTLTVNQPPAITSANNVTFTAGTNGSFTVTASGFPAPAIAETGALPSGITYNATTHVLSGTAAALTGGVYNISFTASNGVGSNATQSFTLTINEAPSITSAASTSFTVGDPGSFTVTVTGFPAPSVAEGGALPNGVTYNAATKTLSGTPGAATAGDYSITFTASNGVGSNAAQNFTLHVVCPTITVTPATLPGGTATQAYSQALGASGGHGAYSYAVSSGALPAGVTLSSTGLLSGTPTQTGTFNFTVTATDSLACVGGISLSLTINCPTLSVGPATLPNATQNVAYNQTVTGSGGVAPYTYTVSAGTLPAGLSLDGTTGAITGTPTTAGTSNFTIKATDVNGCFATQDYTVNVCVTPSVTIVADNATVCAGTLVTFTASPVNGGTTPSYQWQVNGVNAGSDSPSFASSSLQNGDQVTVIMTSNASPCTSANPVTSNTVTMTVNANPATPAITPSASAVCENSTGNTASGPAGATTYAWSISNGTITSAADIQTITWTAGTAASSPTVLTLTVTNASGCSTTNTQNVTVNPTPSAPSITVASAVCAGTTGNTASGPAGATTYSWSISGGTITSATDIQTITWTAGAAGTAHLTLTVTNSSNCAATSGTDVTVNANPSTPTITTASSICADSTGGTASGPAGATTYAWSISGGTITSATDIQNITYTAGASGTVQLSLTVTNASGCSASNNASVTINPNPSTPAITVASAVCENSTGNSASGPAGATTYAWSISNGTITSATNIQSITWTAGTAASSPTVLTLTVTNASGCSTTNTQNVTVNPTPSAPSITVASAVCAGTTGNTASGPAGATTYSWSISGGTITSATNIQTITWTAGAAGTAHLTLTITNASGCAATSGTDVTVNANPSTPTITTASSICADSTGGTASGPAGATTYAWSISGGTITSATDIQSITYTAGASGTVQLSLTVTNASGCSASNNTNVTINPNPSTPAITVVSAVCEGSTGNSASGPAGATTYAWSISNGTITSATNIQSITWTAGTAASSPTVLTLTVTNASGCSATNTANVTVNPTPSAPSITVAAAVCASSTGNSASGPAGATTYAWSITGGTITSATNIQTITWTAGAAGTAHLTLTITNASGCAATGGTDVTVNANPSTPTITTASSICASVTTGSASGPAGATTYAWSITNGTITSATNTQSITYTAGASGTVQLSLTVTNASGCSASNNTNVTINPNPSTPSITVVSAVCEGSTGNSASGPAGATTYAWSISNGTITSAANIQSITWTAGTAASSPTVLTLTVTNASGCSATNTANVTVNPTPSAPSITVASAVCASSTGNSASGPAGATTYSWSITGGTITSATNIQNITWTAGAAGTAHLTLTITNASGCAATSGTDVTVNANPSTPTITTASSICASVTTGSASGPAGATTYSWSITNGTITSATNTQSITYTAGASGTVQLSLTVTNASGCSASNNTNVTINPNPSTPAITAASAVCEASTGNTASGPAGATTYAWSISNGTITSAANIQSITWTAGTAASSPTVLTLTVTNASGCSATNTQNVTINPIPDVPVITAPNLVCGASTGNTASGPAGATTYSWQISGGGGAITSATNIQNITFSAGNSGTITLTLTVTNASGCSRTNTANVTVNPTITLAPTGASPNILTAGTYNTAGYTQSFTTSGGTGPFTMTISPSTPPSGLSFTFNTATGVATLAGTPANVGVFTFSVTTTDSKSCSKTENYSLTIKPKVVDDSFSNAVGNTQAVSSAYSAQPATPKVSYAGTLLTNDQSDQAMTVTAGIVSNGGGSITYETNGNWLFTPTVGFTGTATFAYTVTSNGVSNSGNVNIAVSSMVWWTQPGAAVAGDGRSNTPFNNTSSLTAGVGNSGDIIYIYNNGGVTTNSKSKITLKANQTLTGEGVSLTVNTNLLRSAGTAPTLTNTTGAAPQDVVVINSGNTIAGVTLTNSSAALVSGAPAGLTVANVTFTPSGTANGISLTGGSGTIAISNSTFTGTSSGDVIKSANTTTNTTSWTFTTAPITQTAGRAVNATGMTGGGMTFDANSPITVSAGTSDGAINLTTDTGTTFTFNGLLTLTTSGSATAFNANSAGTVNVTNAASTVSTGAGSAVKVVSTTIGASNMQFKSINHNGNSSAIVLSNTGTGTFTVNGTGSAGTGGTIQNIVGSDAVSLNTTGGLVMLKYMNIQDITASSDSTLTNDIHSGVDAIHGVNVTGGLTLDTVTIQRISDNAINGTVDASPVTGAPTATTWSGLNLINCTISNTNRFNVSGVADGNNEGAVYINGLKGTVSVTNTNISNAACGLCVITATSGTLDMTVRGNTFSTLYKEVGTLSIGLYGVSVVQEGTLSSTIRVGDTQNESNAALGNTFTNAGDRAAIRMITNTGSTGAFKTSVAKNTFTVTDHSSPGQAAGSTLYNFPQSGVLYRSIGSGNFEGIFAANTMTQCMNADGGLGNLSLIFEKGDAEAIVRNNNFNLPWDAPIELRADGQAGGQNSAKVQFTGNAYGDGTVGDGTTDLGGQSPYMPFYTQVRNGGKLDLTIQNENPFGLNDTASGFSASFHAFTTSSTDAFNLFLQNTASPRGYTLNAAASSTYNLFKNGSASVTAQNVLADNGNRGGSASDTTNPPVTNVSGTVTLSAVAPSTPSITPP